MYVIHSQEKKLIKMCKVLFPKSKSFMDNYVEIFMRNRNDPTTEYILEGFLFNEYEEQDKELLYVTMSHIGRIHWFEFFVNYLIPKVYNLNEKDSILNLLYIYDNHIIDTVYEKFKKLQIN